MPPIRQRGTIQTVPERCRVCYTCVRECPAKAIRIEDGQAQVVTERCIGCGNCVKVCSQNAKQIVSSIPRVRKLLAAERKVAAVIAPSFPADFVECDNDIFAGMVFGLGFEWVHEVAFGADLVAKAYRDLLADNPGKRYIATSCPAIILYVEKYCPELIDNLAPIVSPMIASARLMRHLYGDDIRVVFIGPCTSKKCEGVDEDVEGEVDAVLTFAELREMLTEDDIDPNTALARGFSPPRGGAGALFPLSGGMLQAAEIEEDLRTTEVVTANGRIKFIEAIREFESGDLEANLLEVLACDGCIMGAGMNTTAPMFSRRSRVSRHVKRLLDDFDMERWQDNVDKYSTIDLSRKYRNKNQRIEGASKGAISEILARMGKFRPEDELNCGACGYCTCREHAVAIFKGLAESEMCLPYMIDQLRKTVAELGQSNKALESTQEALMQSEKLASMGQLAAGIAHEVNNPLGVVLMYAHLMLEECEDPVQKRDLGLIAEQADRCKKIVAGLLHFARQNKVLHQPTDMDDLVQRSLKSVNKPDDIKVEMDNRLSDPIAEIDGDQIIQVLTNLISNAYAVMDGGGTLRISLTGDGERISVSVTDTGDGIPEEIQAKIFEPFFTTKQIGKGTGLGLSVAYGIVKMHRGNIRFETNTDSSKGPTGTTFILELPRKGE